VVRLMARFTPTSATFRRMSDIAPLTSAVWERVAVCFEAALDLSPADRHAFVTATLGDDVRAQREVFSMLASSTDGQALSIEPRLLAADPGEDRFAAGVRLGAWRIVDMIGRGGMGDVYRAERVDGGFEQPVAIKVLRTGMDRRDTVHRFEVERRILARFDHPHIVAILDGGNTPDGRPYLVMPQVDGLPITEHCDQHRLGLKERLRLFMIVADAVQYAHARLVVHRDIKPSNILVTAAGDVQLLDFGIAKLLVPIDPSGPFPAPQQTQSALRLLTPEHAAPEQVRGEPVTTTTDVYALGVLLYQLLTGLRPHRAGARSLLELEREILSEEPIAPSGAARNRPWQRELRGDLDRIVLMALRKEPDRRYASASQFGEDIDRYLRGLPVRAERDRLGYRTGKFLRRHRGPVGVGAVMGVLLFAVGINTVRQSRIVSRERDAAQQERASAESVVSMLTALLSQANPSLVPGGDTLRVQQLVEIAERQVDSLASTPRLQVRMRQVVAGMQLARGRADLARAEYQRAYEQAMSLTGSDSADVARLYYGYALAVDAYEGTAKSLPMIESAVTRLRRAVSDTSTDLADARRQLAERRADAAELRRVLDEQSTAAGLTQVTDTIDRAARIHSLATERLESGAIIEAIVLFEEALRLVDLKVERSHPIRITVAGNVGTARRVGGEFELADVIARERLDARRAERPVNPAGLASAMETFAILQAERGFLEEAEQQQRAALALIRTTVAPTHNSVALSLRNLALIVSARGRTTEGVVYGDSALSVLRAGTASEADLLVARDVHAELLLRAGRPRDAALELEAIAPATAGRWPLGHAKRTAHEVRRAMVALALGDAAQALSRFDAAQSAIRGRVPPTYPQLAAAQCGRGLALTRLGRIAEARPDVRNGCARYRRYGVAVPLLLRLSESERAATTAP
jgi:eukaryotic-like serine/threonine-protein kinase